MARTPSTMLPLGTPAPAFELPDPHSARSLSRDEAFGPNGLLVLFLCNHCPFVKHVRAQLAELGRFAQDAGVGVVAIMPNDVENYPDDAPHLMVQEKQDAGYTFPYLYDESQEVAKSYQAACTPDFYLFDAQQTLVYRGQLDSSRPGNDVPVTGEDLRRAINALVAGEPPVDPQTPSIGCNIKWIAGNEPAYYGV